MRIRFPLSGTVVRRQPELTRSDHEVLRGLDAMDKNTTELAYRRGADIEVALLWHRTSGELTVSVSDTASCDRFEMRVSPDEALIAFYHPYAYAPRQRTGQPGAPWTTPAAAVSPSTPRSAP